MLCQICKQAKANIHTLCLEGGEWVQHHICEKCALGAGPGSALETGSVIKLFGQMLAQAGEPSSEAGAATGVRCPGCGQSHEQFQNNRRLGCARCYDTFQSELEQIFLRVQDKAVHCGKVPDRPRNPPPSPLELRRLAENLQRAVQEERFEEAARYRDEINRLRQELGETPEV